MRSRGLDRSESARIIFVGVGVAWKSVAMLSAVFAADGDGEGQAAAVSTANAQRLQLLDGEEREGEKVRRFGILGCLTAGGKLHQQFSSSVNTGIVFIYELGLLAHRRYLFVSSGEIPQLVLMRGLMVDLNLHH